MKDRTKSENLIHSYKIGIHKPAVKNVKENNLLKICLICKKPYDGIHEYKDCIVYYHKTGQGHDLTIPKEK
jgi:hypothetical protein